MLLTAGPTNSPRDFIENFLALMNRWQHNNTKIQWFEIVHSEALRHATRKIILAISIVR
jgi:hypothetical protein